MIHYLTHTMADVQVDTFRPTGLLKIEEAMCADSSLPEVEGFVSNGLLAYEPSSIQDTPTQFTSVAPSLPFRQNGLLDPPREKSGTYKM
jgi:hypothetical protein